MAHKIYLIFLMLVPFPLIASEGDTVPVIYEAKKVVISGSSMIVLIPRPFERFDKSRLADSVLRAFDEIKSMNSMDYGKTGISIDQDFMTSKRVTLNLDPDKKESWDLVTSQVFYTLRSFGVLEVHAPQIREAPLDFAFLKMPVFLYSVPYVHALPPNNFVNSLILMPDNEVLPSEVFYKKLKLGDREIVEKILAGLNSENESIRLTTLSAIPYIHLDRKYIRLLPLLSDKSTGVRLAVLKLLESENSKEVNDRLVQVVENDTDPRVKLTAVRILSSRGIKKYDVFIEIEKLSDPDEKVVISAIERLANSKSNAAQGPIAEALRHISPDVRKSALQALINMGARDTMASVLNDDRVDLETREAIAKDLMNNGNSAQEVKGMNYLVTSGKPESACLAVKRIKERRAEGGLKILYSALLRPEAEVRREAANAIPVYRDMESLKVLLGAAKTDAERVEFEGIAVSIIAIQPIDTILAMMEGQDTTMRRLAMKAFGDSLKGGVPPPKALHVLEARLSDSDLGVRRAAVYALARVTDEKILMKIMGLANDPDPEIREAAMTAAGRVSSPTANDILLRGLNDEADRVKMAALDGISAKKIKGAKETLEMMGKYQDVNIRRKVAKAYISLLDPGEAANAMDFLTNLLYDTDPQVKLYAIEAVSQVNERRAIVAISGLVIDPNKDVKLAAIRALAKTKQKDALEGIEKAVFDNDKEIRIAALEGLKQLGLKDALDFLSELLKMETDAEIRAKAEEVQNSLLAQ